MELLLSRIIETIDTYELFSPDTPLVVMVSGGGDSVALLRLLLSAQMGECVHASNITVLHVNHLLRGADSDADEVFVRELCAELGVALEVRRVDAAAYAAEHGGLNLEDAGRQIRYAEAEALLERLGGGRESLPVGGRMWASVPTKALDSANKGRIVTAHTRDDRVETFFIRAVFGSGTGALAGIAPKRGNLVRPLLDIDRSQLRDWLTAGNHSWREDASNEDLERTRAYVRATIIPAAEHLRPNFRENLARTMNLVADDDRLLSNLAHGFARDFAIEVTPNVSVSLDTTLLATLDRVMARRTLRCAILDTFADASRLEAFHIEALVDALHCEKYSRDIPPALRATINCATLSITRISAQRRTEQKG